MKPGELDYAAAHVAAAQAASDESPLHLHLGDWGDGGEWTPEPGSEADLRRAQVRLDQRVRAHAGLQSGQAILDIGCGLGGTLLAIDRALEGVRLVGVNIDPDQLAVARRALQARARNGWSLHEANACALPFASASFDRVLAIECAFHFPSRARFLAEVGRVLRPGGRLVLTDFVASPALAEQSEPLAPARLSRAIEILVEALAPWPDPRHSEGGYTKLAERAGLEPREIVDLRAACAPSYDHILFGKPREFEVEVLGRDERGCAALAWLCEQDWLRLELRSFERRPCD